MYDPAQDESTPRLATRVVAELGDLAAKVRDARSRQRTRLAAINKRIHSTRRACLSRARRSGSSGARSSARIKPEALRATAR